MGGERDRPGVATHVMHEKFIKMENPHNEDEVPDAFVVVDKEEIGCGKLVKVDSTSSSGTPVSGSKIADQSSIMPDACKAVGASLSKSGRSTTVSKNARGAPKATVKSRFPEAKHRPEEMDATGEGSSSPSPVRSQACDHSQLCAQVEAASAFVSASYRTAREKALDLYRGTMTSLGCVADAVRPRWHERCHLPEVLKRVKSRRFPLLLALLLSVAVTLSWNWMLARSHSKSWEDTEEWQARFEELKRELDAKTASARYAYDSLGAQHGALQAEHDALLKFLNINEQRSCGKSVGGECPSELMGSQMGGSGGWSTKEAAHGPVQSAKEAYLAAEKSAYDMMKHFVDGIKRDVKEMADVERCLDGGEKRETAVAGADDDARGGDQSYGSKGDGGDDKVHVRTIIGDPGSRWVQGGGVGVGGEAMRIFPAGYERREVKAADASIDQVGMGGGLASSREVEGGKIRDEQQLGAKAGKGGGDGKAKKSKTQEKKWEKEGKVGKKQKKRKEEGVETRGKKEERESKRKSGKGEGDGKKGKLKLKLEEDGVGKKAKKANGEKNEKLGKEGRGHKKLKVEKEKDKKAEKRKKMNQEREERNPKGKP